MLDDKLIDVYEHALLHLMQENEQLRNDLWKANERLKRNRITAKDVRDELGIKATEVKGEDWWGSTWR